MSSHTCLHYKMPSGFLTQHANVQGNERSVRAAVMRLPMYTYGKNFSFFYDVRYKAAEKKGAASYVGGGMLLLALHYVATGGIMGSAISLLASATPFCYIWFQVVGTCL